MKTKDEIIEEKYEQVEYPGSLGGVTRLFNELKTTNKNIKKGDVEKYLSKQDEYTLHKPIRKKFNRNRVVVYGIDNTWEMDLVDMRKHSKENKGFHYILTVIDIFSKFAWGKLLINKKQETVLEALKSIINDSGRIPNKIHADEGKEFWNLQLKNYLEKQNIKLYITQSGLKASVVERFNRTLKERMYRWFTLKKQDVYYDVFDKFFDSYNSSYHRSIRMKPKEVNKTNSKKVFANIYGYDKDEGEVKFVKMLLKIGDYVRISKYKNIFSKGYESNWTREVFVVDKVIFNNSNPVYSLKDLLDEEIEGLFYVEELQKVSINISQSLDNNNLEINQILETKIENGQKFFRVNWRYYPKTKTDWIKESEIKK